VLGATFVERPSRRGPPLHFLLRAFKSVKDVSETRKTIVKGRDSSSIFENRSLRSGFKGHAREGVFMEEISEAKSLNSCSRKGGSLTNLCKSVLREKGFNGNVRESNFKAEAARAMLLIRRLGKEISTTAWLEHLLARDNSRTTFVNSFEGENFEGRYSQLQFQFQREKDFKSDVHGPISALLVDTRSINRLQRRCSQKPCS
jgi:hypothetical protein